MQKQKKNVVKMLSAGLAAALVSTGILPVFADTEKKEEAPERIAVYLDKEEGSDQNQGDSEKEALKSLKAVWESIQKKEEEALKKAEEEDGVLQKEEETAESEWVLILCGDTELTAGEKKELQKEKLPVMTLEEFEKLLKEEAAEMTGEPSPAPEPSEENPETTVTPTPVPAPTEEPEKEPEATPTPEATVTPEPEKEPEATPTPEATVTPEPEKEPDTTPEPEATVTPEPEKEPEATPSPEATVTPEPEKEPEAATPAASERTAAAASLVWRSLPGLDLVGNGTLVSVEQPVSGTGQTTGAGGSLTPQRPAQAVPTGDMSRTLPYTLSTAVAVLGGGILLRLQLEKRRESSRAAGRRELEKFKEDCKIK